MSFFLVLLQIQLIALLVAVWVLHRNLPSFVLEIIKKNSARLDGTFSQQRYRIERQSVTNSLAVINLVALFLFVMTALTGLAVADLSLPLPEIKFGPSIDHQSVSTFNVAATSGAQRSQPKPQRKRHFNKSISHRPESQVANSQPSETQVPSFQWPLVSVYFFSSFIVCPLMIARVHRAAIDRYRCHGHIRFLDYYRAEWVRAMSQERGSQDVDDDDTGSKDLPIDKELAQLRP